MANNLSNGRISLSPSEKRVAETMFNIVADGVRSGAIDAGDVLARVAENLTYAEDSDHYRGDPDLVPVRDAGQAIVDLSADLAVRFEIAGCTSEKW